MRSPCYASAMTILSEFDRTALADAQADLAAVLGKGDTQAERDKTEARDALVVEVHARHAGKRGLVVEIARALAYKDKEGRPRHVHRTTVHRIFTHQVTGRHAYRRAPMRARA